jgi:hypothetical protein
MDNRIFRINGCGKQMLANVLELAIYQHGGCYEFDRNNHKVKGWTFSQNHGLVLLWAPNENNPKHHKFIAPLGPQALAETAYDWLATEEAKTVTHGQWEDDCDHDGHNSQGWLVYCEDWGHVDGDWRAFAAVKPVYLWHGK